VRGLHNDEIACRLGIFRGKRCASQQGGENEADGPHRTHAAVIALRLQAGCAWSQLD